jgi:ABC-type lipoprotein release transport system permease subunit
MNITLRLAWRNLWRQPRRTWLTIGAMAFSNIILVFMISLQFGMYEMMIDNTLALFTGHLQVQAEGYKDDGKIRQVVPAAQDLADSIETKIHIAGVSVRANAFALASSADRSFGVQVIGVQPESEIDVSTIPGLMISGEYLDGGSEQVVIGSVLARNLKVTVDDELTLIGSGRDGSFAAAVATVAGIFETSIVDLDRGLVQMPLALFQDVFYMGDAAHEIVVRFDSVDAVQAGVAAVSSILPADSNLVVHDWDALQPGLKQAIQADIAGAWFMYGLLVVLVAFSVLNTVLMSVLERTREFGIVLSLGLSPGRLARLVLLETFLMASLGLLLGVLIGWLVITWVGYTGFSYPGMEEMAGKFNLPDRFYPQASATSLLLGPGVVFLGTLIASLYPALRIHLLHPVQAMRAA